MLRYLSLFVRWFWEEMEEEHKWAFEIDRKVVDLEKIKIEKDDDWNHNWAADN